MEVDEVGPSLKFAQASVQRASRGDSAPRQQRSAPADDPWATPAAAGGFGVGAYSSEEPPF
jgi:single-strand DNA-binding protein